MDHVLTLIAAQGSHLDDALITQAGAALAGLGGQSGAVDWLAPGLAVDIPFTGPDAGSVDAAIRPLVAGRTVDVVVSPVLGRRKMLLVADMDSTMVIGETLDELADFAGIKDKIAAITARAMNGEIGFEGALRERIGLLRGLPQSALEETWAGVHFTPGARTLVQTMKANGAYAVLVSGGFKFFTTRVRDACGFDEDLANQFIFDDQGGLAGVADPILGRETKLATLRATAQRLGLTEFQAVAVGDGANDLDMIQAAGMGVAFHAKPVVAAEARLRIDHGDLTALLFAQGYRLEQFKA